MKVTFGKPVTAPLLKIKRELKTGIYDRLKMSLKSSTEGFLVCILRSFRVFSLGHWKSGCQSQWNWLLRKARFRNVSPGPFNDAHSLIKSKYDFWCKFNKDRRKPMSLLSNTAVTDWTLFNRV